MSRVCLALASALLLAAGGAIADDAVRTQNLEVKERLKHLERIDVTAEKAPNPNAEPLDSELLAILEEAERLEEAPRSEKAGD